MPSTSSPVRAAQAGELDDLQVAAGEAQPVGRSPSAATQGLYVARALRLFCIRVLNYLTNHVVAQVPSFTREMLGGANGRTT